MEVDQVSVVQPFIDQTTRTSTSSAASTSTSRISMFKGKTGFVIPKNKLSGSLVPIFKGGKKQGSNNTANDENSKEVKRKTKWGADLTQDPSVKRGRILAYQTRLDQITSLLKSRSEEIEAVDLDLATQDPDQEPSNLQDNQEKLKNLELEKRELIGEILKLNPSFKPPPDYKPLLKEAKVPIHVKKYPGYNFPGLIYGAGTDTQKRLEKETGAKIQVYGVKENGKHKVALGVSDVKENQGDYEEMYVLVSADTYEKVDAAASLVELLVNPVSNKPASVPGDDLNVPKGNETPTLVSDHNSAVVNGVVLPPIQNPAQNQFLYNGQWLQKGPPLTIIGAPSPFGTRQVHTSNIGPIPSNSSLVPPRPPQAFQAAPNAFMPEAPPLGQTSAASMPSLPNTSVPLSFNGGQYSGPMMSPALRPQAISNPPLERAMNTVGSSTGWTGLQVPNTSLNRPISGPVMSPYMPSQGGPFPTSSNLPYHTTRAPVLNPAAIIPSFTPLRPQHFGEPRTDSNSGNFTYQPHRPQNPNPQQPFWPNSQHGMQNSFPPRPGFHPVETRPFPHLNANSSAPHSVNQMVPNHGHLPHVPFDRNPNQISTSPRLPPFLGDGPGPGYAPSSHPIQQMGPRSLIPANQMLNSADPFYSRPRTIHLQQNFAPPQTHPGNFSYSNPFNISPLFEPGRPASGPSSRQKFYDPFSPTSVPRPPQQRQEQQPGGNLPKSRGQENDPEYEDLMASVGVK